MKKLAVSLLVCILFISCFEAIATSTIVDLSSLTVDELDELSSQIENEKRKATEVTSSIKNLLETDFMKAVADICPSGTTFSYPFFGLSIVHRQYYYCVCGTVGCHFPDKTNKDLWDTTIIYWYDKETDYYYRAAFYTRDEVFFVDQSALSHVIPYAEKVALDNIKSHKIIIEEAGTRGAVDKSSQPVATATPNPTSTPKPTSTPTPQPTATPTPSPTPKPTPTPEPTTSRSPDSVFSERVAAIIAASRNDEKTATPKLTPKPTPKRTATPKPTTRKKVTPKPRENVNSYVLNVSTKKFHKPSCSSVTRMSEKNKRYFTGTRQEVINMGYDPCQKCHP